MDAGLSAPGTLPCERRYSRKSTKTLREQDDHGCALIVRTAA